MSRRRSKRRILPDTPVMASIEQLAHDGTGVARIEGKTTFIQGALPDETVQFKYTEMKNQYDKGLCIEVMTPSPLRVKPKCHYYDICGGCSLQHLKIEEQIAAKEVQLLNHLKHTGKTTPKSILPPLTGKSWGYRHKARLSVKYVIKKEKVLVGFRERLSGRFIADIEQCEVLHPAVGLLIHDLKQMIATLSNYQDIAQCEVAIGDNQNALILRHLSTLTDSDLAILGEFGKTHCIKWYLQSGGPDTVKPLDGDEAFLTYDLPDWGLTMSFKPTDFTQVNPSINAKMVSLALDLLDLTKEDRVLDLFCGLGNFSLPIASQSKEVIGVEGSDDMVERARMNAHLNQLDNTQFFSADLFKSLEAFEWANQTYDKVLLDPPRAGALELCQKIERFQAKRIVYVSCSPQTLARDSDVLVNEKGYTLLKAGVMDMFPHTSHVESIALFEKKGA